MNQIIIGISELKNLILAIKLKNGIDFSDYALSSLKRRIEIFMLKFHFLNIDELIQRIEKDEYFYKLFIKEILVDTTELFRDWEFWKELKIRVLNKFKNLKDIKILIPECNSGEELYSLLIVLKQMDLLEKVRVYTTSLSQLNIEKIINAAIELKKMEVNIANFERIYKNGNIFDFFTKKGSVAKLNPDLLENIEIVEHNMFNDELHEKYNLILYRNKTIYYNQQLKTAALKILGNSLKNGGFITVGIKETMEFPGVEKQFVVVSNSEKIYKKTIFE